MQVTALGRTFISRCGGVGSTNRLIPGEDLVVRTRGIVCGRANRPGRTANERSNDALQAPRPQVCSRRSRELRPADLVQHPVIGRRSRPPLPLASLRLTAFALSSSPPSSFLHSPLPAFLSWIGANRGPACVTASSVSPHKQREAQTRAIRTFTAIPCDVPVVDGLQVPGQCLPDGSR